MPQILDSNGDPIVGAKLYFYEVGTTTLKTIYSNAGLSTSTTNPQVADPEGRYSGDIFLNGLYKVVQKDADDVTIWTKDPIGTSAEGQFELWSTDKTYNIPEVVLGSDDEYYISLTDSNQGNDPTISTTDWELFYLNRVKYKKGADLGDTDIDASNILTIGTDGDYFDIAGTQQIDEIASVGIGRTIKLHFDTARTLTHDSANLALPGGADIVTAAGDEAEFYEYASGDWRCLVYTRASKLSLYKADSSSDITLAAGDNNAISFGTVTIPTAGLITLNFTGRINETSVAANRFGWGVKIGASYFYSKYDDNGVTATGSDSQTSSVEIDASEYRILYGPNTSISGTNIFNGIAYLDIEALGITTGTNTVEFAIDAVGAADLKGTLVTSRFYMKIEDYT